MPRVGEPLGGVYYNEFEPFAVLWLRNLVEAGHLPQGFIDGKDIRRVNPEDVRKYNVCHFFAGIGGWPYALRLAEWPSTEGVWTASCPCQPFSNAGKRQGEADERHLWPVLRDLIAECHPSTIFGEQVASEDGRKWLAGVRADLEALGYAVGAADLCAAGVKAPHIRQRLFWVADSRKERWERGTSLEGVRGLSAERGQKRDNASNNSLVSGLSDSTESRLERPSRTGSERDIGPSSSSSSSGMEYPEGNGREQWRAESERGSIVGGCGWGDFDILSFRDGKSRRIESGIFPLAHGIPNRVGRLRAYGNAIVPQIAAEFIRAYLSARG